MRDQRDMVRHMDNGVRIACAGTCNKAYPREELKVANGGAYCSSCFPATPPAHGMKAHILSGMLYEWRKR